MKRTIRWRHQDDAERNEELSLATASVTTEPSKCQLQYAQDADINVIVARFGLDPKLPPPEAFDPRYYGDVTAIPDLRSALDTVRDAQERFRALPARLRERFANDPARLWNFVNDPANIDEAVNLGLLTRAAPPQAPNGAPPIPEAPPAPPSPS